MAVSNFSKLPVNEREMFLQLFSVIMFFLNFKFYIGLYPINSVAVVSGTQQGASTIHIHVPILPHVLLFFCH